MLSSAECNGQSRVSSTLSHTPSTACDRRSRRTAVSTLERNTGILPNLCRGRLCVAPSPPPRPTSAAQRADAVAACIGRPSSGRLLRGRVTLGVTSAVGGRALVVSVPARGGGGARHEAADCCCCYFSLWASLPRPHPSHPGVASARAGGRRQLADARDPVAGGGGHCSPRAAPVHACVGASLCLTTDARCG